jgi:hypothetical protein
MEADLSAHQRSRGEPTQTKAVMGWLVGVAGTLETMHSQETHIGQQRTARSQTDQYVVRIELSKPPITPNVDDGVSDDAICLVLNQSRQSLFGHV